VFLQAVAQALRAAPERRPDQPLPHERRPEQLLVWGRLRLWRISLAGVQHGSRRPITMLLVKQRLTPGNISRLRY